MIKCNHCGELVNETQRFCPSCGGTLRKPLSAASEQRDLLTMRYCKHCNTEVASAQECPHCNRKTHTYGSNMSRNFLGLGSKSSSPSAPISSRAIFNLLLTVAGTIVFYFRQNHMYAGIFLIGSIMNLFRLLAPQNLKGEDVKSNKEPKD